MQRLFCFEKNILTYPEVKNFLVIVYSKNNSFLCLKTQSGDIYYQNHHERAKILFKNLTNNFGFYQLLNYNDLFFLINSKYVFGNIIVEIIKNIDFLLPPKINNKSDLLWNLTEISNKILNGKIILEKTYDDEDEEEDKKWDEDEEEDKKWDEEKDKVFKKKEVFKNYKGKNISKKNLSELINSELPAKREYPKKVSYNYKEKKSKELDRELDDYFKRKL